jgi:hypothetical protein
MTNEQIIDGLRASDNLDDIQLVRRYDWMQTLLAKGRLSSEEHRTVLTLREVVNRELDFVKNGKR